MIASMTSPAVANCETTTESYELSAVSKCISMELLRLSLSLSSMILGTQSGMYAFDQKRRCWMALVIGT